MIEHLGLCKFVKFINGFPGIRELVADLNEEFMGELEIAEGERGVES